MTGAITDAKEAAGGVAGSGVRVGHGGCGIIPGGGREASLVVRAEQRSFRRVIRVARAVSASMEPRPAIHGAGVSRQIP